MNIFLAGNIGRDCPQEFIDFKSKFVLQTFVDCRLWSEARQKQVVASPEMFLLDSGAFTFMNTGGKVDWDSYADEYVDFIIRNDVKHFLELDLDTVIGIEQTARMTERIETKTGKKCIPVFHACRGLQTWREMCKTHSYVAIGASGLTDECKWVNNSDILRQMIRIAHKSGAKVHGLGYTRLKNMNDTTVPFDSIDSSSCLSGGRFATLYKFTGTRLISKSIKGKSPGYKKLNEINIKEWIKMQYYKAGDRYEEN